MTALMLTGSLGAAGAAAAGASGAFSATLAGEQAAKAKAAITVKPAARC